MQKKKFTKKEVDEIITKYTEEPIGMTAIGKLYGVSKTIINRILIENNIPLTKPGQKYKGGKKAADKRMGEKYKLSGYNKENQKKWLSTNKKHRKEWYENWFEKNKDDIKIKRKEYQKKLLSKNPQYKLSQRFRTAIWQNIKDNGICKYNNTFNLLPYTFNELKLHLENLFTEGMNWDNYGEWHVDHAIPQTNFKYETTDSEEFIKCWSLGNLKPMWGKVNAAKNDSLTYLSLDAVRILLESNKMDFSNIKYNDILISKEYLKSIIENYGKEYLNEYLDDILMLIKKISPILPKITTNENLELLSKYINNIDPLDSENNIVNAKVNSYGNMFLKSRFNSYWNSKYENSKTPYETWLDDKDMKTVLKYRLGLNDSNEIFDISLKQMIKGLSATRKTISFFKPLLASYLYRKYLGTKDAPTVLDPCCGFGGRLLGFKLAYPNGTYIGCEPNVDTYNELIELSNNFTNIKLYNCRFEDLVIDFDYDLALTSIPYMNREIYSNHQIYSDIKTWEQTFLRKILALKNAVINMDMKTCEEFGLTDKIKYYLINNKTHFNRNFKKECFIEY